MVRRSYCLLLVLVVISISGSAASFSPEIEGYRIVRVYPHDPTAFTQGLLFVDGHMYESTGLHGRSSIRMVDLATGRVLQRYNLPAQYFGEGLTDWGSTLVQLTWESH